MAEREGCRAAVYARFTGSQVHGFTGSRGSQVHGSSGFAGSRVLQVHVAEYSGEHAKSSYYLAWSAAFVLLGRRRCLRAADRGHGQLPGFLKGSAIGGEEATVRRTPAGITITSNGRLAAPLDLLTRQCVLRYDANWRPIELTVDAVTRGAGAGDQDDICRRQGDQRGHAGWRADDQDRHGRPRYAGAPQPLLQRLRGAGDAAGEHPRRVVVSGLHRPAGRDHRQAERAVDAEDRDGPSGDRRPRLRADLPEPRQSARRHRVDRRDRAAAEVRGPGAVADLRPRRPRVGGHARARRQPRWRSVGANPGQRLQPGGHAQPALGPAARRIQGALSRDRARGRVGATPIATRRSRASPCSGCWPRRWPMRATTCFATTSAASGKAAAAPKPRRCRTLAEDVRAVVQFLRKRKDVDRESHRAGRPQRRRAGVAAGCQPRRRSGRRRPGGGAVRHWRRAGPRAAAVPAGQDEPARRRARRHASTCRSAFRRRCSARARGTASRSR